MNSKNYLKVKEWFDLNVWDINRVRNAVVMKWITASEFEIITGEKY